MSKKETNDHIADIKSAASEAAIVVAEAASNAANVVARAAASATAIVNTDIAYIKNDIAEIKLKLDNKYVTIEAFEPVRKLVYGLVAIVLVGVVSAIIGLVLVKP